MITQHNGKYILAVEGNLLLGEQGCSVSAAVDRLLRNSNGAAAGASAIIASGACASWAARAGRATQSDAGNAYRQSHHRQTDHQSTCCPPIPDVMSAIITYMVTFDCLPDVDRMGCPFMFDGQRIHDKCYRRAHFDAGEFVQSWDDDAARKGYCLYKMGCKGPTTYNACSSTRWNDGVSFPIQSGHGCLVCAENGFWDRGSFTAAWSIFHKRVPFHRRHRRLTALGVVAAAVGVHAVASAVDQRRRHNQQPTETEHQPGNEDNRHEHSVRNSGIHHQQCRTPPVVDPITRIEGHMRCEVNINDQNVITNAVSCGTMFRGLEIILQGRDPRDAWAFVERSAASVLAYTPCFGLRHRRCHRH
ncbi:hydrogenase small subunit [Shigella sonnei]